MVPQCVRDLRLSQEQPAGWLHTLRPDADLGGMVLHGRRDADSTADWWPELHPICV